VLVAWIVLSIGTVAGQTRALQDRQQERAAQTASQSSPAARVVVGVDARIESSESTARFTIALSDEVEARVEMLSQPMRIVVDLPEIAFQAGQDASRRSGIVRSYRAGLVAPGRSRIVFDLAAPAKVAQLRTVRRAPGVVDLVIEFERTTTQLFAAAALEGAERRAKEALRPLRPATETGDSRPLVVIDPGHGGIDPGAVARGGVMEKGIVLAIGQKLRDVIAASGHIRVVMTRDDDRFVTLSDRVRIARESQAALFISLHADSLSAAQEVRGATVYTGSERATDAESARLAQKENAADALGGAETKEADGAVAEILMDLARRETRWSSATAAALLVSEMSNTVKMHRIPQRSAGFRVLTAPDVPSILIELGYLSSKNDIELLSSPLWQQKAAEAIGRAVARKLGPSNGAAGAGASISP
jgi:N-acetylmuramoyl-L-alanine amidase